VIDKLLVCFQSGARGEFLASILLGKIPRNRAVLNLPLSLFKKIHHINDSKETFSIESSQIKNYFSVRIRLNTLSDFTKLIYLRKIKGISNEWFEFGHLFTCIDQELYQRQFDKEFNYIVDFENINNLDYIKNFYQMCCQQSMSQAVEDWAVANINLNLNLINNKQYELFLKDFDSESLEHAIDRMTDQNI
jgi:hypothetical protein